jgi:chromosome segregation ATPase
MSTKTTVKSFVKEFAAILKGDDATAQAEKAFRQSSSALRTQVSSLEGDTISKEDALTDAQEAQKKARVNNGQPITNRDAYVQNLISKKNDVTKAQDALDAHKDKIEFLKGELALLETEVDA